MKILFIEDTASWVNEFLPQLQTLGEVTHFKSTRSALNAVESNDYDLIVCDHNILLFENETRHSEGREIYLYCRFAGINTPFIHFSYDPCPELYPSENDPHFYSLKKEKGAKLISLIKTIIS